MNKLLTILLFFLSLSLVGCKAQQTDIPMTSISPTNKQVLIIAHRGARSLAPENTLSSAQKGLEVGADGWELDVAMTVDNELVVLHDDTLNRTSNVATVFPNRRPWEVHLFTLAELRSLDFGSWYNQTDPFKQIKEGNVSEADQQSYINTQIPTLREALEFTKTNQWHVNVEIKDLTGKPGDPIVVEKVVALIGELEMENRVLISSFNQSYLVRVKKANPQLETAVLVSQPDSDPVALLNRLDASAYNPTAKIANQDQFNALRAAGYDIYVWTVNDEQTMKQMIAMGATGIFTDYPQVLKKVLTNQSGK